MSGWYDQHVLPHMINLVCSDKETTRQRQKIVPLATGEVLEIGFGSGLNVPHYDTAKVDKIWALEPSAGMRRKATAMVRSAAVEIEFLALPGEQIPLPDASVDTVLVTYSLCTIEDAVLALEGMRRVLRPGGRLLFCEHGLAPDESVRRWQHRLNAPWRAVAGGCNMNRDIPAMINAAGFDIMSDERKYVAGPKILCYNYRGVATAAQN